MEKNKALGVEDIKIPYDEENIDNIRVDHIAPTAYVISMEKSGSKIEQIVTVAGRKACVNALLK